MRQNRVSTVFALLLAWAFTTVLQSAPPELAPLQEHYARAVTAPYEEGKVALETKYGSALAAAAKTAQQAGQLDEVLALTQEQKRLADRLPIPEEEDGAPESLKKLRIIYHGQTTRLAAELEASTTKLLPAYTEKLKELESSLTKVGRIPDALEVKTYRESLAAGLVVVNSPITEAPAPAENMPAAVPSPRIKGDDRKAAEWIMANWSEHRIWIDSKKVTVPADLPTGNFALSAISIDGRYYTGATPLDGATLMQNLGGLEKLRALSLGSFPDLKDNDFAFVATLDFLDELALRKTSGVTDAIVPHLIGLRKLKLLEISEIEGFTGSTLAEWPNPPIEELKLWKCSISDATITGFSGFRKLRLLTISGHERITDASLPALRNLPSLEELVVSGTNITPAGLASAPMSRVTGLSCNSLSGQVLKGIAPQVAPAFPNVTRFQISYAVPTPEDLAALAHFKKLKVLANYGVIEDAAWPGLLELRDLVFFSQDGSQPLPDIAFPILAQLKKLEALNIGDSPPSAAALAAFQAARPDVRIEN